MKIELAENIKRYRKERKLTQEQLAEVLGVTPGAVYKWEAKLSVPELQMIVEMADFFDVSVDVLLGYQIRDNTREAIGDRINDLLQAGDREAMTEIEKALKKYPHSFQVVYGAAQVYLVFGAEENDEALLRRALHLYEESLLLISQNDNPTISESTIYGGIGNVQLALGEVEKGIETLKRHNAGELFNTDIGLALAMQMGRPDEAERYLSHALLNHSYELMEAACGYAFVFSQRADYESEKQIVSWGLHLMDGIRSSESVNYLLKMEAPLEALLAHAERHLGREEKASAALRRAAEMALRFDAAPDFSFSGIRFIESVEGSLHDGMSSTAEGSVERLLQMLDDGELQSMWKNIVAEMHEESCGEEIR